MKYRFQKESSYKACILYLDRIARAYTRTPALKEVEVNKFSSYSDMFVIDDYIVKNFKDAKRLI